MTSARLIDLPLPALDLEAGGRVDPHVARVWWWGPEADRAVVSAWSPVSGDVAAPVRPRGALGSPGVRPFEAEIPTVVILHALTGHAVAGGPAGWWSPVIGEGQPLDPARHRLLSIALLGGCYGSSGPLDPTFPREGTEAAAVTTWDQARAALLALDQLGVRNIDLLTGGSLGAMVAVCLAALAPDRVGRMALFGGCTTASPWIVGFNHVGAGIVRALRDAGDAARGLELARQLAMLTYRAEPGLEDRQARDPKAWSGRAPYPVDTWLDHHGKKLRARFDPDAYLCLLGAMSHHDLARAPGSPGVSESWSAFSGPPEDRIRASTLAVGIDTDNLYLPVHMASFAARLRDRGIPAESALLVSRHGHDAFLIEWPQVRALLAHSWDLPLASGGDVCPPG